MDDDAELAAKQAEVSAALAQERLKGAPKVEAGSTLGKRMSLPGWGLDESVKKELDKNE